MHKLFLKYNYRHTCLLWLVAVLGFVVPGRAQVLPLEQKNTISSDWMVYEEGATQLVPFIANVHTNYNAVHQWLAITPAQPFRIGFTAQKELCLFLNNQLIFKADSAAAYTLDLSRYSKELKPVNGQKYLLTVWHPLQQPNISTFRNQAQMQAAGQKVSERPFAVRAREYINQNAFILFTLLIGLIYGSLKTSFPADFNSIFRAGSFLRNNPLDEGYLVKPIGSWSSVLFVLAFSLSLAMLVAAIHTNVQHVRLFNRLFPVSEADITTKTLFYTFLIFVFILLKYLFLKMMGFIFGLEQLVQLQYREFLRTTLFLGIFLPGIMLLYLGLNTYMPETILILSNVAVSLVLVLTIFKVFITVNQKASVLNLHLFSYLCATEVIPLAIMLKFIVFNF